MSEWNLEKFVHEIIRLGAHNGIVEFFRRLKPAQIVINWPFAEWKGASIRVSVGTDFALFNEGTEFERLFNALKWLESRTEKDCCQEAREQRSRVRKRGYKYTAPVYSCEYKGPDFIWNAAKGETYTEQDKFVANSIKCNRCGKPLDKEDC